MRSHLPGDARLDLLGGPIPAGFDAQVVVLAHGGELVGETDGWRDALVEVEHGEVELELASGESRHFGPGDLLVLMDGRLRARPGAPAVLVAVWRAADPGADPLDGLFVPERDEKSGERRLNVHDDTHGPRRNDPQP
jgi:hypothetical protein